MYQFEINSKVENGTENKTEQQVRNADFDYSPLGFKNVLSLNMKKLQILFTMNFTNFPKRTLVSYVTQILPSDFPNKIGDFGKVCYPIS